jgi:outer membrane immunogenic protein
MRLSVLGLAAATVIAFAGTAGAADIAPAPMSVKASPPPAPVYSWTGCNVNAGIGYGFTDTEHSTVNATNGVLFDAGHDNAGRGWLGRFGGGCDYQFYSSFVVGAFADYDWANIHGRYSYASAVGAAAFGGDQKLSSEWAAGLRLGFVVMPQLLSYVDGGYTQAHFDAATFNDLTGGAATVSYPSQTRSGWFIGGGAEYAVGWWKNLFWRTEYRFAQYGSRTVASVCNVTLNGCVAGAAHGLDTSKVFEQTITSSLVWRFW